MTNKLTNECVHGQLARACSLCEMHGEIARLTRDLDVYQRENAALKETQETMVQENARLRGELSLAQEGLAAFAQERAAEPRECPKCLQPTTGGCSREGCPQVNRRDHP